MAAIRTTPFIISNDQQGAASPVTDDAFSMVGDDPAHNHDDRDRYVKTFYQGEPTCKCCINWVDQAPENLALDDEMSEDDESVPLVVRRRRSEDGAKTWKVHSIEIKNAGLRAVLLKVFDNYQFLLPSLKYLTFLAPFHPFYYAWDKFEAAIKDEKDETVLSALKVLRRLVKIALGSDPSVSKELIASGVISYSCLWTLFKPGQLLYHNNMGADTFVRLNAISDNGNITTSYVDWDGRRFGWVQRTIIFHHFTGTMEIAKLEAYPAHMHPNYEQLKKRLIERGQKFKELAGIHTKTYSSEEQGDGSPANSAKTLRRIVIDAKSDRGIYNDITTQLWHPIPQLTNQIQQQPLESTANRPRGQHIPLDSNKRPKNQPFGVPPLPPPPPPRVPDFSLSRLACDVAMLKGKAEFRDNGLGATLTPDELMCCNDRVKGFCFRDRRWRFFEVDRINEVEWNEEPFNNLVLPDGYKDLIIAFVESQLKDNDRFEDVINGKGGGLVILLCGAPGVGKTLTAESVAEKIRAPLLKMEPMEDVDNSNDDSDDEGNRPVGLMGVPGSRKPKKVTIEDQFQYATAWNAVLLFDECDAHLAKRSGNEKSQDHILNKFLRKLEYFPSLLFLTTNHVDSLDPAIASRVHLTINYPELNTDSRLTIWRNFLDRADPPAALSWSEIEMLSRLELNGRRIRNVVKTAQIMAKREQRAVRLDDVKKVMKITEGLHFE